jgi:hypothetical protein
MRRRADISGIEGTAGRLPLLWQCEARTSLLSRKANLTLEGKKA